MVHRRAQREREERSERQKGLERLNAISAQPRPLLLSTSNVVLISFALPPTFARFHLVKPWVMHERRWGTQGPSQYASLFLLPRHPHVLDEVASTLYQPTLNASLEHLAQVSELDIQNTHLPNELATLGPTVIFGATAARQLY